jgi:polyisoprenoid-binding protein YceI
MATWIIDPAHSEVQFKVRHLVISTVTGSFKNFEGKLISDKEDFSDAKISFSASIDSIDTNNAQRDGHLKSPDFFDAASHPKLSFESTSLIAKSGSEYLLKGNLSLKGVTKPVELITDHGGIGKDLYGNTVAAFELSGKINRQDFGLTWSALTEAGGAVVSDEIKLHINIELKKS